MRGRNLLLSALGSVALISGEAMAKSGHLTHDDAVIVKEKVCPLPQVDGMDRLKKALACAQPNKIGHVPHDERSRAIVASVICPQGPQAGWDHLRESLDCSGRDTLPALTGAASLAVSPRPSEPRSLPACSSIPYYELDGSVPYGSEIPVEAIENTYGVADHQLIASDSPRFRADSGANLLDGQNHLPVVEDRRPCANVIVRTDEPVNRTTGEGKDPHLLLDPRKVPLGEESMFSISVEIPAGWTYLQSERTELQKGVIGMWVADSCTIPDTEPLSAPSVTPLTNGNVRWRTYVEVMPRELGGHCVVVGYQFPGTTEWVQIGSRSFTVVPSPVELESTLK